MYALAGGSCVWEKASEMEKGLGEAPAEDATVLIIGDELCRGVGRATRQPSAPRFSQLVNTAQRCISRLGFSQL